MILGWVVGVRGSGDCVAVSRRIPVFVAPHLANELRAAGSQAS